MGYYDDYYENPEPVYAGCYCKMNFVCSECKKNYN